MATNSTSKKTAKKTVKVELEKAEEKKPAKGLVSQVSPQVIATIKNQAQIDEELETKLKEDDKSLAQKQVRNRIYFYGGVAAGLGILYLLHRYTKNAPPVEYASMLANGVVDSGLSVVTK